MADERAAQDLMKNLSEQQKSLYRAIATTDESIIIPALEDVKTYTNLIQENVKVIESKALKENMSVVSEQQERSMNEIQNGMGQISSVVQSNSAVAEENSATSEELYAQASTLSEVVSQFKLRV